MSLYSTTYFSSDTTQITDPFSNEQYAPTQQLSPTCTTSIQTAGYSEETSYPSIADGMLQAGLAQLASEYSSVNPSDSTTWTTAHYWEYSSFPLVQHSFIAIGSWDATNIPSGCIGFRGTDNNSWGFGGYNNVGWDHTSGSPPLHGVVLIQPVPDSTEYNNSSLKFVGYETAWPDSPQVPAFAVVPEPVVTIGEDPPATGNASHYVGSRVTLYANVETIDANANITSVAWTITGPDGKDGLITADPLTGLDYTKGLVYQTVKTHTDTHGAGANITKLSIPLSGGPYYWGSLPGTYTVFAVVHYTAFGSGSQKAVSIPGGVTIQAPNVTITSTDFGKTFAAHLVNAAGNLIGNYLGCGAPGGPGGQGDFKNLLGIKSILNVASAQSLGTNAQFGIIQVASKGGFLKSYAKWNRQNTAFSSYATPIGKPGPNDPFPLGQLDAGPLADYGISTNPPFYPDTLTTYNSANGSTITFQDAPYTMAFDVAYKHVYVETFNDYLMFKPDGGVFVPILYAAWQFSGAMEIGRTSATLVSRTDPQWANLKGSSIPASWTPMSNTSDGSVAKTHNVPAWSSDFAKYILRGLSGRLYRLNNVSDPDVDYPEIVENYALDIAYDYFIPLTTNYTSVNNGDSFNSYAHPIEMTDMPSDWASQTYGVYKYDGAQQENNDVFNNYVYTPNDVSNIISGIPLGGLNRYCYERFNGAQFQGAVNVG